MCTHIGEQATIDKIKLRQFGASQDIKLAVKEYDIRTQQPDGATVVQAPCRTNGPSQLAAF